MNAHLGMHVLRRSALATFGVMGLTHWRFPELWRLRKVGHEPAR